MRKTVSALLALTFLVTPFGLCLPQNAFAHGGEIEVGGGGTRGPVQLSDEQKKSIALETAAADFRSLASLLEINGEAEVSPDHQAAVTSRISGQIQNVYTGLGDTVKEGQKLARIEGRAVGNASVTLTAPMDGVIDARNIVTGQAVEPGTELFKISDRSEMIMEGKVYEEDLGKVKTGQEARVHLLAYPGNVIIGVVTLIEPDLDPLSRTVRVWVRLDNSQNLLKPHMFARIGIVLKKNDAALSIPNKAIIEANGEKFVFVREGDKFNRVEVKTGAADDEYSEITDGLVPGDEVVTQGNREIYTMWLTGGQMKSEDED